MRSVILLLLIFCSFFSGMAQNTGWQQRVDYQINVTLLDSTRQLEGELRMYYQNNSPDALDTLWLHLWANGYSRYNTDLAVQLLQHGNLSLDQLDRSELGAIGKLDIKANDRPVEFGELPRRPDIGFIVLNEPLEPGSALEISTPFKVKVPRLFSRMGYEGDFYAITQWFPKAAVYDREGWHAMPYLEYGEFYADFGKYMVTINVPERFKVAATGNPTNEMVSDGMRTVIYQQENIHDFAWFASPDFQYISREITLENDHRVLIETYYLTDEERWRKSVETTEKALRYFSGKIGPYPYHHCTIVEGPAGAGGGMEYPTIAVMEDTENPAWMENVIAHEVAHNWWQGILASNERKYPWIDEGFTSFYDYRYGRERSDQPFEPLGNIGQSRLARFFGIDHLQYADYIKLYLLQMERLNVQQAPGSPSEALTEENYTLQLYYKVPQLLIHLMEYMGPENFDRCIGEFYTAHQFRHVFPEQLQEHLEQCSGKDLAFFFDGLIRDGGVVDHKLLKVKEQDGATLVTLKSKGDISIPIPVTAQLENGDTTFWIEACTESFQIPYPGVKRVWLDRDNLSMDYRRSDNSMRNGFLGKVETIRPQLLASLENPERSQLFFAPVISGNTHDKFMLGMAFYNRVYPAKQVDWSIVPFYAFGSKQVNGIFNLSYYQNIRKDRQVQLGYHTHFRTFSYNDISSGGRYLSFSPSVTATILSKDRTKNIRHILEWKHFQSWTEVNQFGRVDSVITFLGTVYDPLWTERLGVTLERDDIKTPITASAYTQFNDRAVKAGMETTFKVRYGKINSYFSGRFFLEAFLYKKNGVASAGNLTGGSLKSSLGGTTGGADYLYEHEYIGRSETSGFAAHQIAMDQGRFKFASPSLLRSDILVSAVNVTADFPSKWIPIKLYADFGLAINEPGDGLFAFQMGAMLSLLEESIEVYFPFFSSSEIKTFYDLNQPKYKQRISFSFNLEKLNPHKMARDFRLL